MIKSTLNTDAYGNVLVTGGVKPNVNSNNKIFIMDPHTYEWSESFELCGESDEFGNDVNTNSDLFQFEDNSDHFK